MSAATLPDDQRLIEISPKAYEHPADRAATAALKSIPMLDTVVRKLIEYGYERAFRQMLLANALRVGATERRRAGCSRPRARTAGSRSSTGRAATPRCAPPPRPGSRRPSRCS